MYTDIFEQALNLKPPFYIKDLNFCAVNKRLDIHIDFHKGSRFDYAEHSGCKVHDTINKTWRHLNFFEHECLLHARIPRLYVDEKVKTFKAPWEGVNSGFTLLFEALIVQMAQYMPVQNIAEIIKEDDEKLWRILHKYVDRAREHVDLSDLTKLGLDETSQSKGHDYVTVFVDMEKRKTVCVTEGKDNTTVKDFIKDLEGHKGKPENITHVSSDMSPAFIKGITENLSNAEITFDRFHVMGLVSKAVNTVRIEEAKENPILKGTKFIFLKNKENLTEKQSREFKEVLSLQKYNLKTVRALHLREAFQAVYQTETKAEFIDALKAWYSWARRCRLEPMKEAANSIKKHWDGIVSWFDSKLSNGLLEGLNSIIQAAKRKARGDKTRSYKTIIYLLTADLNFKLINPHVK